MLRINAITYRIEGRPLFEQASVNIPTGHKVGLVGRNGTGKTTLFRLLYGEIEADDGEFSMPRTWRIGGVAQEAPGSETSLLDTVLEADVERTALLAESETASDPMRIAEIETRLADIGAHRAPARAAEILAGLGFDAEAQTRPCSEFSGGWRMRVALAAVLFSNPDLLLLDEPTNYLDLEGSLWLEQYLRRFPGTMILISHDRDLLNTAVNSILHLEDKKLTLYTGSYDIFERTRAERLAVQEAARVKQETQRKHMQSFVDRFRYKASKARQAQSRLKAIAKLQPIAEMTSERVAPFRLGEPEELSPPLLALESTAAGYDGREVISQMTLRLDPDDRIALLGANGNGKSTFAKLISNRIKPMDGTITKARRLRIGYFAQHQLDEMNANLTPVAHLSNLLPSGTQEREIRRRLGAAGFPESKADTAIGNLSGGERARLLIMIAALEAPHLLILDEPTNHLDIDSREALVMALNDYPGAVLLISHDPHLIETCADRLWLVAGGRVTPFDGDMDDYRRFLLDERQGDVGKSKGGGKQSRAEERRVAAERRAQIAPLKKAADAAEKALAILNGELSKVEAALNIPGIYEKEPPRVIALTKQRTDLAKKIADAEAKWLEATEAYEAARGAGGETNS